MKNKMKRILVIQIALIAVLASSCFVTAQIKDEKFYRATADDLRPGSYFLILPIVRENSSQQFFLVVENSVLYSSVYKSRFSPGEYSNYIYGKLQKHDTLFISDDQYNSFTKYRLERQIFPANSYVKLEERKFKAKMKQRFKWDKTSKSYVGYGFMDMTSEDFCLIKNMFDRKILVGRNSYTGNYYYIDFKK